MTTAHPLSSTSPPAAGDEATSSLPGEQLPLTSRANRGLESLTRMVERSGVLSSIGKAVTEPVAKLIGTGKIKDLLSGTWVGHPAHPMLTDIPIGAWSSAALLDLMELCGRSRAESRRGADTLVGVGVLAALPTAASGLSDFSDEMDKPVLAAGAAHALGSLAATGLFAASWLARLRGKRASGIALSMIGTGVLTAAGFLGGHLSYRKGLGVDHNAFDHPLSEWTGVMNAAELADGEPQQLAVAGHEIMLYRTNGTIHALANRCSHRGGPLHEGKIEGDVVVCPWHSGRFCIQDGSVVAGPPVAPQPCYETRVREGEIQVRSKI